MKHYFLCTVLLLGTVITSFTACTTFNHSMREPNVRLDLVKNDFTISDQVSADAKSLKILCIDWSRLFMAKTGNIHNPGAGGISLASIPVIGNITNDKTANYALYDLMTNNPGYDVVLYPQYETKVFRPIGIGFIVKTTTVKVTARLGKLNK